ncbi:hypothetical protein LINPERPRIM_LOCUS37570 [Linum perenne]
MTHFSSINTHQLCCNIED